MDAFLRGIERRAWLFLWLQGGRPEAAEPALAAALRAFAGDATGRPMAEWPDRFWRLVATLPVREDGHWPEPLAWLATLGSEPRRALLLRMAAGLDERAAAAALDVTLATYRERLSIACPRDAAGEADVRAWHRLAEAVQQAGRELPPERLRRLAELRAAALQGRPLPPAARPAAPSPRRATAVSGRRRWIWMALVAALCAAALAATWWLEPPAADGAPADGGADGGELRVTDHGPILVEELPAPPAPAVEPVPVPMPEPPADPVVAALDLYAWYAAGAPASALEREAGGGAAADGEETDATPQAPPPEEPAAAWQRLDPVEQRRVREAASAFQALPPARQAELRAQFAALDAMERRGWLLGPALGADWVALQPLFGFVGADEREALLAALRGLGPEARAQLARLAHRTPPQARAALRRELLAQPPERRAAWLEAAAQR